MKKKKVIVLLASVMALSLAVPAMAAPSISQIIPEAPKNVTGITGNQELIVQNADTKSYENKTVASAVEKANDDNTKTTVREILKDLGSPTQNVTATNGKKVNPTLYEQLTPFVDLAVKENDKVTYNSTGQITATLTVEAAKEMKKSDLMLMQIDPSTGKVSFILPDKVDSGTGEITATFPGLGPVAVLEKVPVVSRHIDPDRYPDKKTAEIVKKHENIIKGVSLLDVIKEFRGDDATQIETTGGNTINLSEYSSVSAFVDIAIQLGSDYSYEMDGELTADVHINLQDVDWQTLVSDAYPDFDVDAAEEDHSLLTSLDSFVPADTVLLAVNAETGEQIVNDDIKISFDYSDETAGTEAVSDESTEAESASLEDTEEEDKWNVYKEEEYVKEQTDQTDPTMKIEGVYGGMGPHSLFRKNK